MADASPHAVVWAEIPVTDMKRASAFYEKIFKQPLTENNEGPNPVLFLPTSDPKGGIAGHLYPGKPAGEGAGPTVHLAVPDDLESAMDRTEAAGGKVHRQVIEIPMGRFAYATDPDGNSIGLFEQTA